MTEYALLSALLGAGAGLGLIVLVSGLKRRAVEPHPPFNPRILVRLAATIGITVLVGAITRWPVGAALAGLAAWFLPKALGPDREHARQVARIEAVAVWAEMLRDTLAASAGLHQAVGSTAAIAPEPIRAEVMELSARLDQGERLPYALKLLADDLADPTGDLVCGALILAAKRQAGQLGDLLGRLAEASRAHAVMRLRIAAARAQTRSSMRTIMAVTVLMAGGLMLFNRDFLAPYGTAIGQVVLLLVGLVFAASFLLIQRLGRIGEPPRVLTNLED
ncbi:type II secretion system F family protein [Nonomuraea endophytica]|uniref:type II secretion system F family protein n=1 Tax=Nonomuraea endophytica TaxID=714136 RepID=UPI0037C6EB7B